MFVCSAIEQKKVDLQNGRVAKTVLQQFWLVIHIIANRHLLKDGVVNTTIHFTEPELSM